MSRVLNAEIPAEASTATPPEQAPVVVKDDSSLSFAEQQQRWTPEQRQEWKLTGKEPAPAAAPAEKPETREPSVPKGKTEAATEPAEEDQELPEGETVEARRARNQMFAKLRRERAAFKAEAELLKSQRLEKPARVEDSAPAPKVEPKSELKEPNIDDYDGTPGKGFAEYMRDMREHDRKVLLESIKADRQTEKANETAKERESRVENEWETRQKAVLAKQDSEDPETHRTRMLEYANASRWLVSEIKKAGATDIEQAILESEQGPRLLLHFGENREEFASLLAMSTHRALLAIGKIEARFDRDKTPELKPVTRTLTPDPGPRVNSKASAPADPLKEAYDMHTKTGDSKYLRIAMKLENERAAAKATKGK